MNVLLIGLRGSGKSTVGRLLADRIGAAFVDLDDVTPREMGLVTVAEAWRKGQEAFRLAEASALIASLGRDNQVIALGGGTPTAPGAADVIRRERRAGRALVVYLRCDPATLRERMASQGELAAQRPSLTGGDPLGEIESVYASRDPLYCGLADVVLRDCATAEEAARRIAAENEDAE